MHQNWFQRGSGGAYSQTPLGMLGHPLLHTEIWDQVEYTAGVCACAYLRPRTSMVGMRSCCTFHLFHTLLSHTLTHTVPCPNTSYTQCPFHVLMVYVWCLHSMSQCGHVIDVIYIYTSPGMRLGNRLRSPNCAECHGFGSEAISVTTSCERVNCNA